MSCFVAQVPSRSLNLKSLLTSKSHSKIPLLLKTAHLKKRRRRIS